CFELLKKMKEESIHCAVDTCGNVPWSAFESVLPVTDMFLYDFKCADTEKHRKLTGQGNELILENLKKLDATGKRIEIRMIMVPEHNMGEEDLCAAGEFLAKLENVEAVRLLAYHALARSKFKAVGHPDTMPDVESPDVGTLEKCAELLRAHGVKKVIDSLK
ncbi:MAG: radical SAM protein, partial [Lentisphaeria bacterium]|nr:radical SAM protein [Lentisphaeria bacterium]